MARITKAEKTKRVTEIVSLLLSGVSRGEILQYSANKGWGVAERTVDDYIAAANEEITAQAEDEIEAERGKMKMQLDDLYKRHMANKDFRGARLILRDRASLLGLDAPKKIDQNNTGELEVIVKYVSDD